MTTANSHSTIVSRDTVTEWHKQIMTNNMIKDFSPKEKINHQRTMMMWASQTDESDQIIISKIIRISDKFWLILI